MAMFLDLFKPRPDERILDVGGNTELWREIGYEGPIVFLNIVPLDEGVILQPGWTYVIGDGRRLPFESGEFSIVFSNSVIEHVGDWQDQLHFASEIERVGQRYWVQTPNRRFPIEPHMMFPAFQWLPDALARPVVALWPFSFHRRDGRSTEEAWDAMQHTRLMTVVEMRQAFPGAVLVRERALSLTKSIVAYRL